MSYRRHNSFGSFSHSTPMPRGRGGYTSRGPYRGSSSRGTRGSTSWSVGGRGGGGYTPRGSTRGSRSYESFSTPFGGERPRFGGSSERYSSGSSRGHDDFKKPYRMEMSFSSRESSHRSPERKRPRTEALSSRHDSSYGGGYGSGGGSGRGYHDTSSTSGYSERRSFSNERHHHHHHHGHHENAAPFTTSSLSSGRRSDDFRTSRLPTMSRNPRGTYRGRLNTRGSRGGGMRLFREPLAPPTSRRPPLQRRLIDSSYAVRKRILPTRTTDYARRLKISKMRSAIAARKKNEAKSDGDEEEEEKDGNEEELDDENQDDAEQDGGAAGKTKEATLKEGAAADEPHVKEERNEGAIESPVKKTFIKLNCPQCGVKAVTFRKYELHLQGRTHMMAMRKASLKQKAILAQMRMAQRSAQNELEKSSGDLSPWTNFCPLCKLNYKQRKAVHQLSEAHKNMKKFLMPYCKVCSLAFKSPMMYESHCCSVEHLKRKQRIENGENSDEGDEEMTLENFTTIDSVGVDGDGSEEEEKKDVQKEPVNVGFEHVRKVEAYYCDLCKTYIGNGSEAPSDATMAKHCKLRLHLRKYIAYKEDKDIEKRAEKLQRKETAEKEEKKSGKTTEEEPAVKAGGEKKEEGSTEKSAVQADDEAQDDKLWADVDKDLDDLLGAKEGARDSDEDEDVNGERYDRFNSSEKNGEAEKPAKEAVVATAAPEETAAAAPATTEAATAE